MHYMLAFNETQADFAERSHPERGPAYRGAWTAYIGATIQAGVFVSGNGLLTPETGTIVRLRDGVRQVQDGPHPDSKEQLGGYLIIEAPDLDTALTWAARSPSASTGSTEVRPVMPPMPAQ